MSKVGWILFLVKVEKTFSNVIVAIMKIFERKREEQQTLKIYEADGFSF